MGEKFFVENYLEHLFLRKMLLYAALFCLLALDHSVSGQGANGQVGSQQILCMFSCDKKPQNIFLIFLYLSTFLLPRSQPQYFV